MYQVLQIFEGLPESSLNDDLLNEFVQSCKEQESFSNENISASSSNFSPARSLVSFLKKKLNSSLENERLAGLHLLHGFTWNACSEEQWVENQLNWMTHCMRGIEQSASIETNIVAYNALGRLLDIAVRFGGMSKEMNTIVVAKFVERATKTKPQVVPAVLGCLAKLMRNYGSALSSHRLVLEQFILKFADSRDPSLVSAAASCFVHLTQLGGAGVKGTNLETRWLDHESRTVSTVDSLLGQLFEHVVETHGGHRDDGTGKLPLEAETEVEPIARVRAVATRLVNISRFLEEMLLDEFPVAKNVEVDRIMRVVSRGLSVNSAVVCNQAGSELLAVGSCLPAVQVALYRVLASLIACLQLHLMPHGNAICHLSLQTLQWTSGGGAATYGIARPRARLRQAAYNVLSSWLQAAGAASAVTATAEKIAQEAVTDIYTEKPALRLTAQPGKKKKKLRKQLASENDPSSTSANRERLHDLSANHETCSAALDALYWLVHSNGTELSAQLHKSLQDTVVKALLEVQRDVAPIPYSRPECLAALYSLLAALTLRPHPTWPPPTQHALHLLAGGARHADHRVARVCTTNLASVKCLVEPRSQPISFPVSLLEMQASVKLPSGAEPEEAEEEVEEPVMTVKEPVETTEKPSETIKIQEPQRVEVSSPESDFELVNLSSEEGDQELAAEKCTISDDSESELRLDSEEEEEPTVTTVKIADRPSITVTPITVKISPVKLKSPSKFISNEDIEEVLLEDDDNDDCKIVLQEPSTVTLQNGGQSEKKLTNGKAVVFEEMDEDQFVEAALDDFKTALKGN